MLNVLIKISVQQVTPYVDDTGKQVSRTNSFIINTVKSFEAYSTWKNLGDKATVVIPKNTVAYYTEEGKIKHWGSQDIPDNEAVLPSSVFVGGFPIAPDEFQPPLFMRGDQITIEAGYYYPASQNLDKTFNYTTTTNVIFQGFITTVFSGIPIKLECEDNFWLLKQTKAPPKYYESAINNMGAILDDLMACTIPTGGKTFSEAGYSYEMAPEGNAFFQLNVGNIRIGDNVSWGQVFQDLIKKHYLHFYFRGNVLRGGGIVYYPGDFGSLPTFYFQRNIIQHEEQKSNPKTSLHYELESDVNIGAVCYSDIKAKITTMSPTGITRTSTKRIEVNVGSPKINASEFFTFFFADVTDIDTLKSLGETQLQKYYFTGFRGEFTTFGLPLVTHGNIITLQDLLLPERNGNYLVKGVKFSGSTTGGLRQKVEIDVRTDNMSAAQKQYGF